MFRSLFISFAFFSVAYSQSCDASVSSGPCDAVLSACSNNQVCDIAATQCCPVTTAAAAATTTAAAVTTIVTDADGSTVTATVTTAATATVTSSTTTCVDRTNPSTGVSDCPALAYLCNDSTYYTVMTQQCPRTCGRCNTTSTSTTCVDRVNPSTGVSDCPARAALCNDSNYFTVMTQQCPRTCGRCNTTSSTTTSTSTSCADRVNPTTGVSDCAARAALCNNSVYYDLMTVQCPATCGRCNSSSSTVTSSSSTTVSSTCVDRVNAATGTSDCANRRAFCTNAAYITLMRTQCPLTCGFCTSG